MIAPIEKSCALLSKAPDCVFFSPGYFCTLLAIQNTTTSQAPSLFRVIAVLISFCPWRAAVAATAAVDFCFCCCARPYPTPPPFFLLFFFGFIIISVEGRGTVQRGLCTLTKYQKKSPVASSVAVGNVGVCVGVVGAPRCGEYGAWCHERNL